MRRAAAIVVVVGMAAVPALAAPSRDELVRPGKSVGKFRLGVTEAELRRTAGKPNYVLDKGGTFGRKRVEYQYGAGAEYAVALAGAEGRLRVVAVMTYLRGQRLPNGLGVGKRERTVMKTYGRRLRCVPWKTHVYQGVRYVGDGRSGDLPTRECLLPGPEGAATVFVSSIPEPQAKLSEAHLAVVIEVGVRATTR